MAKIKGFALSRFRDAGTGERFAGEQVHEFEAGQFANYRAAGLIRKPTAAELRKKLAA